MQKARSIARPLGLAFRFAAFSLLSTGGFAQDWVDRSTNITRQTCNVYFSGRWASDTGLHFKVSSPDNRKSVVIEVSGKEGRIILTPEKAFPPCVTEGSQFNLVALPSNALASAQLTLKFRQESWALYVEGRPVAVFPAPFYPPAILSQPRTELPPEDKREVKLQQTADILFHDDFMVPEETADDAKLSLWDKRSGTWLLHTAADSAIEREYFKADAKKTTLKPAFSANFYSLKGAGTNAVIAAGYDFYDSYSVEASVQTKPGEMGIVFYLQESGAYHAFTIRMEDDADDAVFALWKTTSTNQPQREFLGAVSAPLTQGQWVMLKARTFQNRIQCFVDNIKVLDIPAELPPGGRFGLYVTSDAGIRFDDVTVESNHDLDFLGISDVRRHALAMNGSFFPKKRFFSLFGEPEARNFLKPERSEQAQWLVVGSTAHGGHVFSADFEPDRMDKPWCAGLLMAYTGDDRPWLRFTCRRSDNREQFLLEEAGSSSATVLEKLSVPVPGGRQTARSINLMCDATNEKELRLYRDGEMVLIHHLDKPQQGGSGVYVGPDTSVRISNLSYQFQRENLYRNKLEKNKLYVEDPFMRNWSSPEGQWLEVTNGVAWYQGDIFGRFLMRLPYVNGIEAHLGIEEGQSNGAFMVMARPSDLALIPGPDYHRAKPLATAPTTAFCDPQKGTNWFTIHCEGYWLWLTGEDKVLFKQQLKYPLKGRRARLSGFATNQLKDTYVERYNVKDFLFTESLHDWVINGGQWEVVNRFQCDPRWSHMNGESTNGLAAIWTKYEYTGDFCIEMYTGTRMGWYQRCGDMNFTILNTRTTPSEGYTVTCTGWDYDHSQLYTKLYRNGEILSQSDKYMVPRYREGNKRMGFNPLVAAGRDVHGAWYYTKLRRVGKKLEFYFDNELAFTAEDPNPTAGGSAGIWTYINSMMVARVKIAAEAIRPKPFPFSSTLALFAGLPHPKTGDQPSRYADVLKDGRPMETLIPEYWDMDDPVGHSRLSWHEESGGGPYLVAQNVLGGGTLFARCKAPTVPYPELAGWRFYVKRTPGAQFNLHYSVGRKKADGEYAAERQYFHRITGPAFSQGPFKMSGQSDVPATPATNSDWHASGPWTLVEVWLATEGLRDYAKDTNLLVKVEGFGNLQQSYEVQGLTGNAPGDGYAVKDLAEVRFSLPKLSLATNLPPPNAFSVIEFKSGKTLVSPTNLAGVQAWINGMPTNGFYRQALRVERPGGTSRLTLAWLRLPPTATFSCAWAGRYPNAVALLPTTRYPDRRFAFALLSVGNILAPLSDEASGERYALVPRRFDFCEATSNGIPIMVAVDGRTSTYSLPWKDCSLQDPPVLLRIDGLTPLYEGFERRELAEPLAADPSRMKIASFDPEQGSYLQVFNTELNQRLRAGFSVPLVLARHPVVQFRYRGTSMASVSLSLGDQYFAKVNEENPNAKPVREAKPFRLDGKWHTWLGFVSDAVAERAFDFRLLSVPSLVLASYNGIDQTGRYTRWDLDDIAVGPAVSSKEQLAFSPYYFDFNGVQTVSMAIREGPESYFDLTPDQAKGLRWREIPNMARTVPEVDGLTNGFCHILLKARDRRGNESSVTDVPFILDKQPPQTASSPENSDDPLSNGALLRVNFTNPGSGAPLDLDNLKVRWDDKDVAVPPLCSTFTHSPDRDAVVLNWPYVFRDLLNQSKNGQTFKIVLAGIRDGASNAAPDVVVPMTIDYAKDHRPPTVLQSEYPTNVLWTTAWEVGSEKGLFFLSGEGIAATTLVRETNDAPYLCSVAATNGGSLSHSFEAAPWSLAGYPYLSFRIRRPDMQANDPTRIDMVLETMQGQTNVLSLTHTATGATAVVLSEPITWQSNTWYSLTFDVPQLLKAKYKPEELKDMKIKTLRLTRSGSTATNTVHVQSFYVFAPWKPVDRVKMNTYDASGMEGVAWASETAAKGMTLTPASLPVQGQNTGWIAMRPRDKAGNSSPPLWVPAGGTNAPSASGMQ